MPSFLHPLFNTVMNFIWNLFSSQWTNAVSHWLQLLDLNGFLDLAKVKVSLLRWLAWHYRVKSTRLIVFAAQVYKKKNARNVSIPFVLSCWLDATTEDFHSSYSQFSICFRFLYLGSWIYTINIRWNALSNFNNRKVKTQLFVQIGRATIQKMFT